MTTAVSSIESLIAHTFTTKALCLEALRCKGASASLEANKRLALLGDHCIKYHLVKNWFPKEGLIRTADEIIKSINAENLAAIGRRMGIATLAQVNPGQGSASDGQIADVMKALVAAVDIDGGDVEALLKKMELLK